MAEPTGPGTAAPVPHAGPNAPRDASHWAAKVDRLRVEAREGVRGSNVAGKRLTGPVQGFGKMWQKTYSVDVGPGIPPEDAIAIWKAHFPEFWPDGNRFAGALTGISPGDVALLDIAVGGGVKLSTGVFVLYADAESFTFATPEGHQFAAWITFSAERSGDATVVQTQVLLRPVTRSTSWACRSCTGWRTGSGPDHDRAGEAPRRGRPGRPDADGMRGPQAPVAPRGQRVAELHGPQRAADRDPAARGQVPLSHSVPSDTLKAMLSVPAANVTRW